MTFSLHFDQSCTNFHTTYLYDKIILEYHGNFVDGQRSGKGNMIFTNGDTYTGEFFQDKITGKGDYKFNRISKYTYNTSDISGIKISISNFVDSYPEYDGPLRNGKRNGTGIE